MINNILPGMIGQLQVSGSIPPGTIQIGTPGTSGDSLGLAPFSFAWDWSFVAWIIEASEMSSIGGSVTFNEIEFFFGDMSNSSFTMNSQRMYMAHIDKSDWLGDLPVVGMAGENITNTTYTLTNFNKTFTSAEENDWLAFPFNNNFTWNGTDNVVIWWENRDGSYSFGGPRFDRQNKSNSVAFRRVDSALYPTGQSTSISAERPVMKLNYI
jgi:hypothetical protein